MLMLTVDQMIAALTGIATLITALATFLTVREIARQRQTSYRPELVAANNVIKGLAEPGYPLRPFRWVNPTDNSEGVPFLEPPCGVTFFNVGMAAAKHVEVDWRMDIASYSKAFNELAQRNLIQINTQYEKGGSLKIKGENGLDELYGIGNQLHHVWPYLLPASIDRNGLIVPVPFFLLRLYSLALVLEVAQERRPGLFTSSLIPHSSTLALKYADIGGGIYTKRFQVHLKLILTTFGNTDTQGRNSVSACMVSIEAEQV